MTELMLSVGSPSSSTGEPGDSDTCRAACAAADVHLPRSSSYEKLPSVHVGAVGGGSSPLPCGLHLTDKEPGTKIPCSLSTHHGGEAVEGGEDKRDILTLRKHQPKNQTAW